MNFIGIIGGILGFVGLALPWWTMTVSQSGVSADISMYLYRYTVSGPGISQSGEGAWYGWVVLALLLIGSVIGLAGSVIIAKRRPILATGGILALIAAILFPIGFQMEISNMPANTSGILPPGLNIGLFSSGSFDYQGYVTLNYSSYLSFGFWIALAGAILILVAATRKIPTEAPVAVYAAPPPPPPPQP